MPDFVIQSVRDLVDFIPGKHNWMFRGVDDARYQLTPSIGRMTMRRHMPRTEDERRLLERFQQQTRPHLKINLLTQLEWLIFAQHHGLPTRLLDWSQSALVAAYFAVATIRTEKVRNETTGEEFERGIDGAIWARPMRGPIFPEASDPFEVTGTHLVVPPHVTERITRQSGLLTLHGPPSGVWQRAPTEGGQIGELRTMLIPAARKGDIKDQLANLGIHQASLFPDATGIAGHLAWQFTLDRVL
jgi:hypothetical protein